METVTKSCILETAERIRKVREKCRKQKVSEDIQDTYEDIIDSILKKFGISEKQRELFWTLTDE